MKPRAKEREARLPYNYPNRLTVEVIADKLKHDADYLISCKANSDEINAHLAVAKFVKKNKAELPCVVSDYLKHTLQVIEGMPHNEALVKVIKDTMQALGKARVNYN